MMGRAAKLKQARKEERGKLLSSAQINRAINKEYGRQKAKQTMLFTQEQIACMLWVVHKVCGYGRIRLMRFLKLYKKTAKSLTDFYETEYNEEGAEWFFAKKLKEETGIDVYQIWEIEDAEPEGAG